MEVVNNGSAAVADKASLAKKLAPAEQSVAQTAEKTVTTTSTADVVTISDEALELYQSEQLASTSSGDASQLENGGGTRPPEEPEAVPAPQVQTYNGGGTRPPESEGDDSNPNP